MAAISPLQHLEYVARQRANRIFEAGGITAALSLSHGAQNMSVAEAEANRLTPNYTWRENPADALRNARKRIREAYNLPPDYPV